MNHSIMQLFSMVRPFRVGLFGPSGSGKSVIIENLFRMNASFIKARFGTRILFINKTNKEHQQVNILNHDLKLGLKRRNVIHRITPQTWTYLKQWLKGQYDQNHKQTTTQKKLLQTVEKESEESDSDEDLPPPKKRKNLPRLLIMDDVIGSVSSHNMSIGELLALCRHNQCSLIISIQYINALNKTVRSNLTGCVFLDADLGDSPAILAKSFKPGNISLKEFTEMLFKFSKNKPNFRIYPAFVRNSKYYFPLQVTLYQQNSHEQSTHQEKNPEHDTDGDDE